MALQGPSATALSCARSRALHLRLDNPPWIYQDEVAADLVQLDRQIADGYDLEAAQGIFSKAARIMFALRERFCEDTLADAVEQGATQYVVLGAGLNSFAYSGSNLSRRVHVFEVDHPATQTWKRERLHELGIYPDGHVSYIAIDFETETIGEKLLQHGFDPRVPAVFAWTGVTQYLSDETIDQTLKQIVSTSSSGSVLSVQITLKRDLLDQENKKALDYFAGFAAERGETWMNAHDPVDFSAHLARSGFKDVGILSQREATSRYFANRDDGLVAPGYSVMIKAIVA